MKLLIHKNGYHYHKVGCKTTEMKYPDGEYEEIEHQIRMIGKFTQREYAQIKVDGKYYIPCPMCFGKMRN